MKGIILAGGAGTRLYPLTKVTSKQLLPVYDKPMIYYPLSTLMLAGIRDILLISTPSDLPRFRDLLGDGSHFGIRLSYCEQSSPDGVAQALLLAEKFIDNSACTLILGDNIFYGNGFSGVLKRAVNKAECDGRATVFGYYVDEPSRYGVIEFGKNGIAHSIEEKPNVPKSNYAVTGLYFYPKGVSQIAHQIRPSIRGELEITDINQMYLQQGILDVELMGRGFMWLDAGTVECLMDASEFVRMLEKRQGIKIAVPEEIAYRHQWIDYGMLKTIANDYGNNSYGTHLQSVLEGDVH